MNQTIADNAEELRKTLALLQARDLRSMGFEAKIAHNRRLKILEKAYAAATEAASETGRPDRAEQGSSPE